MCGHGFVESIRLSSGTGTRLVRNILVGHSGCRCRQFHQLDVSGCTFSLEFPSEGFFFTTLEHSFAEDSKPGTVKPGTFPLANATGDLRSNPLAGRQSDRNCCPRNKLESARNILNLWWPFGKLLRVPVLRVRMCSPIVAGTVHPSN